MIVGILFSSPLSVLLIFQFACLILTLIFDATDDR